MTNKKNNKKEGIKIVAGNAGVPTNDAIEIVAGTTRVNIDPNNFTITKPINLFQNISEENDS